MRRVVYEVATSLDGFIAGPGGEFDWIPMDPDTIPLFPPPGARVPLRLRGHRVYPKTGTLLLEYDVVA